MQRKIITLATAAAIGAATLVAATSANAGQWVYVPDGATAPRAYIESDRRYVTDPDVYVRAPQRRVYRETVPAPSQGLYVQTDTALNDGCTYHGERNLFGGWHETRDCPD